MHFFRIAIDRIKHKESVNFRSLHLILRGPRLTLTIQIMHGKLTLKTRAYIKTVLELLMILVNLSRVSKNQAWLTTLKICYVVAPVSGAVGS